MSVRIPRSTLILLGVLLVVEIADVLTTHQNLTHGYIEANPLMAPMLAHGAWLPVLLYKSVIYVGFVAVAALFSRMFPRLVQAGLLVVTSLLTLVVVVNLIGVIGVSVVQ